MKLQKSVVFVTKNVKINMLKIKKYHEVKDRCHYREEYRGAARSIYNLKFRVPKEISIFFHNRSNYDYHFIIKELAEEFEGKYTCLGENTEIYITFLLSIQKEVTITDKNGKEIKSHTSQIMIY